MLPRNGSAATADATAANESTSVAVKRSRLRSRSKGGSERSMIVASARSASSRSVPSTTISFPSFGALSANS